MDVRKKKCHSFTNLVTTGVFSWRPWRLSMSGPGKFCDQRMPVSVWLLSICVHGFMFDLPKSPDFEVSETFRDLILQSDLLKVPASACWAIDLGQHEGNLNASGPTAAPRKCSQTLGFGICVPYGYTVSWTIWMFSVVSLPENFCFDRSTLLMSKNFCRTPKY